MGDEGRVGDYDRMTRCGTAVKAIRQGRTGGARARQVKEIVCRWSGCLRAAMNRRGRFNLNSEMRTTKNSKRHETREGCD